MATMKKNIIIIASISLILVIGILFFTAFMLRPSSERAYNSIVNDYQKMREKVENGESVSGREMSKKYVKWLGKIADRTVSDQAQAAELLRIITDNYIEFEDAEVYDWAAELKEFYKYMADGFDDFGVQSFALNKNDSGNFSAQIGYMGEGSYKVSLLSEEEPEIAPDTCIEYDGSIGKYRVLIEFYNIDVTDELLKQHSFWDVKTLYEDPDDPDAFVKMKCVPMHERGVAFYLGSNKPIEPAEQSDESHKLVHLIDSVKVDFEIKE